eukprot:m.57523 g.57523  ORF g.57523 m.57523 type:complete len:215 (+) comp22396_c0_seq2:226-870(+)
MSKQCSVCGTQNPSFSSNAKLDADYCRGCQQIQPFVIVKGYQSTMLGKNILSKTNVWVYGTLKKGFHNHISVGLNAANFICEAVTTQQYPLLILSKYNIPFLLDAPGKGFQIKGEIYQVDTAMLLTLDNLEGHPHWYNRRSIKVETLQTPSSDASVVDVDAYLLPDSLFQPELLQRTDFLHDYALNDHLRGYVSPTDRPAGARDEIIASVKKSA